MRVLLFGGSGLLGSDLRATLPAEFHVATPKSSEVDIADRDAVARSLDEVRPDWVINAAAYTAVDRAESEPDIAARVNGVGPRVIGEVCARYGVRVIHYSTDYVFPGTEARPYREDDPVNPVNTYGRTKLEGERGLLESGADALILRTAWLYGLHGRSFPRTMLERARRGEHTRVVDDQHGRPTWTLDLAMVTWALLRSELRGIVHATASGEPTTWFAIAQRVFQRAGRPELLIPCSSSSFRTAAVRPRYSMLDVGRLEHQLGLLPGWSVSLDRFIDVLVQGADAGCTET